MKKALILAFAALTVAAAPAQEWSLQQCVDYATVHNIDVRSRMLQCENARQDLTESYDRILPQVQAYGNENLNFGRALTAANTYANKNTNSTAFGASVSIPLFQGLSTVRRIALARANIAAAALREAESRDNVAIAVTGAYLQALYTAELAGVARVQASLTQTQLERTRALAQAGRVAELEVAQAQSQHAKALSALAGVVADSILAVTDLRQALDLDAYSTVVPLPLESQTSPTPDLEALVAMSMARNYGIRAAEADVAVAERNISLAKSQYLPTMNLNGGISTNYYHTSGFSNENFGGQMRHNFAQSVGVSLSVPIFDAFGARNSVRRARLQRLDAELQLENSRLQLYKALVSAHTQAQTAARTLEAANTAATAAEAALAAMQTRYDLGRANATELESARTDYIAALSEALRARYDATLRRIILNFHATGQL